MGSLFAFVIFLYWAFGTYYVNWRYENCYGEIKPDLVGFMMASSFYFLFWPFFAHAKWKANYNE